MNNSDFIIYTDGACLGNPGPGGWAAIIFDRKLGRKNKKVGSETLTTNNRMELIAVIEALNIIPTGCSILIFTDSKYVINGIQSWVSKWKKNNWVGSNKKKIKNKDLWLSLDRVSSDLKIEWKWVKGHSGNKNNEEVDRLAKLEAEKLNSI
ncbi:MAG: ribonuclease HI [Pseudomonadota bacterium]|nr:ribonuclease HI [Pseudomonadota bacterium]